MKLNPKLLLDMLYPIGSIYINTTGVNPGTFLGGTWSSFGKGRCLVGQDTQQSEFDTLEETGGSKYIQNHEHTWGGASGYEYMASSPSWISVGSGNTSTAQGGDTRATTGGVKTGSGGVSVGNSGNLQPYIVVSMWKRTA